MAALALLALVLGLAPAAASGLDDPLSGVDAGVGAGPLGLAVDDGVSIEADGVASVDAAPGALSISVPALGPVALDPPAESAASDDGPAHTSAWHEAAKTATAPAVAGPTLSAVALAALAWALRAAGFAPWLPFFSRIEDDALATHPARRQALDLISASPGATVQDVRRALGLAWGTTVHHLRRLERAGLVAVRREGGSKRHYPLGQAPPRDALPAAGRALAALVRDAPGLPQNELARRAGLLAPAACKHLARLEAAGLVVARRMGRAMHYVPTPALAAAVPA